MQPKRSNNKGNFFLEEIVVWGVIFGFEQPLKTRVWHGFPVKRKSEQPYPKWLQKNTWVLALVIGRVHTTALIEMVQTSNHPKYMGMHECIQGCGYSGEDLDAWLVEQVPCFASEIWIWCPNNFYNCWFNLCSSGVSSQKSSYVLWSWKSFGATSYQSQAFRVHQVLLNHAKQLRKGHTFTSPHSKTKGKAGTLACTIGESYLFSFSWKLNYSFPTPTYPRKSTNMDTMETIPMPDFEGVEMYPGSFCVVGWDFHFSLPVRNW